MIQNLGGATRVMLIAMILTLCGLVIYSDVTKTDTNGVLFALFKDVLLLFLGKFFPQSAIEATKTP